MDQQRIDIREIEETEYESASDLVMRSFGARVAPIYSNEGIRTFAWYASTEQLLSRRGHGHTVLIARIDAELVGMVEIRFPGHIAMLFVDPARQQQGIGRALLNKAVERIRTDHPGVKEITVNSSPNSVNVYRSYGFSPVGDPAEQHGIQFVPMTMRLR